MRAPFVVLVVALSASAPLRAQELPEQVRLDRYLLEIAEHERWEQWDKACDLYDTIEREGLKKPADFDFRWGTALFRGRKDEAARARLTAYVQRARSDDPNYATALQYLVDVERRIETARAEAEAEAMKKAEEEATRAKLEQERIAQRAREVQQRRLFLDAELTASASYVGTGFLPMGVGAAVLGGTILIGSAISEGEAFLPSLVGGLVGVAVGALVRAILGDWARAMLPGGAAPWVTPVAIAGVGVLLATIVPIVAYATRLGGSRDVRRDLTVASIAFGGGLVLAVSALWELEARSRYDAAAAGKAAFDAEQRARPVPAPTSDVTGGPGGLRIGLVDGRF